MSRRAPIPSVRVTLIDAEALRPALRWLVWCEADLGRRWVSEALAEFERADGALLEIVDEERKRRAAVRRVPT